MKMISRFVNVSLLPALLIAFIFSAAAQTPQTEQFGLGGSSWRLVKFQGSDEKTLIPDDRTKYTITFATDGSLSAQIDCNRGRGSWKSSGENQLEFGPLAFTRMMCPPGSMHDRIVNDLKLVRSYTIKDGHLFLSLMADGGIYEFEPIEVSNGMAPNSPVASRGPFNYECTKTGGGTETVTATFYETTPALVLIERNHQTRPGFQVEAASGAKYEGQNVMFWEAHGEVTLTWSGTELKCKPLTSPNQ